jgi:ribosomal protein S18 acetylase RimI-like enzyme
MIRCEDWRLAPAAVVEPLVDVERGAWLHDLDWDVRIAWYAVEPARRAGTLAGFLARDADGNVVGWTAFLLHRRSIQVLAFVAPAEATTAALVDAILGSHERAAADTVLFCVRSAAAALPDVLRSRGFRVEPYRYLSAALRPGVAGSAPLRKWAGDSERLAALLAKAYATAGTTRAFAPHGSAAEWTEYVVTLLTTTGCGRFVPSLSFVSPSTRGNELAGAVIVTDIAPGTSHVAQIAVDPSARGQGLARGLLTAAMSTALSMGYARMTLLAADSNYAALSLYEQAGFQDRARFIVAIAEDDEARSTVGLASRSYVTQAVPSA